MSLSPADALREIRRAYQYVELYQDRVLDLFSVLDARLAGHGFALWQSESRSRFRTGAADLRGLRGVDLLPLRDFEITWVSDGREQAEAGAGTFVVVRHIADTSRTSASGEPDSSEGDSLLFGVVVRPAPSFSKDHFSRDWVPCLAGHFNVDPSILWDTSASNEPGPTERGCWWSRRLSLAQIQAPEDFATAFGDPLAAKAVELARRPNVNVGLR